MPSSRLATDRFGNVVAVITTPAVGYEVGEVLPLIGNALGDHGFGWLGRSRYTRQPTDEERLATGTLKRALRAQPPRPIPVVHEDEQLDEREALRACRIEQQRAPVDLIGLAELERGRR